MRVSHWILVALASIIWLAVGLFLLNLGAGFIVGGGGSGLLSLSLVGIGLILGLLKGRTVLAKAANRIVDRILTLPQPASILLVYGRRTYILIFSMMGLGVVMRLTGVPELVRGTVLVAVGTGLIHAGVAIFRRSIQLRSATT